MPVLAMTLLMACQRQQQAHSTLFTALVEPDQGQFRGHTLGQRLSEVRASESDPPTLQDDWGLIYQPALGEQAEASIEYYVEPTDSLQRLAGISANISLPGEVEASQLYRELQDWLDARYEVPDGGLGYFKWKVPAENTEVVLRLMDSKTAISLNFFRPTQRITTP